MASKNSPSHALDQDQTDSVINDCMNERVETRLQIGPPAQERSFETKFVYLI